jgi:hypothetical protein
LVQRLLGTIFACEQSHHGDIIVTLRTYLDTQRSWQKTAAALFTHRQTVMYRIRKISELTAGHDKNVHAGPALVCTADPRGNALLGGQGPWDPSGTVQRPNFFLLTVTPGEVPET